MRINRLERKAYATITTMIACLSLVWILAGCKTKKEVHKQLETLQTEVVTSSKVETAKTDTERQEQAREEEKTNVVTITTTYSPPDTAGRQWKLSETRTEENKDRTKDNLIREVTQKVVEVHDTIYLERTEQSKEVVSESKEVKVKNPLSSILPWLFISIAVIAVWYFGFSRLDVLGLKAKIRRLLRRRE
ncbi:hypothetical protein [Porphyromonas endodontalis]|uniref:hypothetical protein n=1 Tax=Porphyromonas endodontalis TaxID=28124 RepID=UPI0028F03C21|nr:hypothetical protein [Porphyromonas endodontalis]